MILILTEPKDPHANLVEDRLKRRGESTCRFDWSEFPRASSLSVEFRGSRKHVWLKRGGERIDLAACTAGWLRRPGKPLTSERIPDALLRHYAEEECFHLVQDTWNALDIPLLPGPIPAIRNADNKQLQLQLATALGLEIPPTLITTDADEFLAFYREHEGRLIDKFPSTVMAASQRTGGALIRFTQAVTSRDVGYARRLRHSPMLFQAQIPKRFELRITVVGDQVLPAEIHSQATRRTQLDWRHYDWGHTPYRVHRLPDAIRRACLEMVSRLGLRFGAIDMIVTPDDRYVFLEINPNGQWMWIEDETGLPIAEALCDTLLNPAAHSPTPLPHVPLEARP